ncbi:hypothetical protein [Rubrivirga sp. IMCC43871]|uniref:hypothetical protein n=1 Tax=Rubrivirga sp. IMCC43871 TaxID=3391575 RepID=UPI00398FDE57
MRRLGVLLLVLSVVGCRPTVHTPEHAHRAAVDSVRTEHTRHGDPAGAIRRLTAPAERGNPLAMRALGTSYMSSIGVDPNEETAVAWFRQAAALGGSIATARITAYDARAEG